jgi:hypothetical protein
MLFNTACRYNVKMGCPNYTNTVSENGGKELNRYYISDYYEIDDPAVGGIKEKLYLGGDYYTAPAVYVKEGTGSWQVY